MTTRTTSTTRTRVPRRQPLHAGLERALLALVYGGTLFVFGVVAWHLHAWSLTW